MNIRLRLTLAIATIVLAAPLTTGPANAQTGTVIASDDFNRPDEAPFAVSGNWGRTIAGNYDGVSNLTSHQVTSVSNEGIYYWKGAGTFSNTRQFARERVVQKNGEQGLVLLGGSDHSIMVGWGPPGVGSTVYIYWYSGGIDRGQLATGPSTLNNGDLIEAVLDGNVIYAKVNGVTVLSVANTTTITSGTPGFITYLDPNLPGQVSILDDWEAGTPSSSYAISGTITENSAGLGGVLVTASGGFSGGTTTAGDGTYTLSGVPENATSILLTPTRSGHTMSPLTLTVAGPVNADVTGQDFTSTATMVTPGVIAADDFNRADETPFATGGNWQQPFGGGTVNLTGQHAVGAGGEALYYWQGPGSFDNASQFARATVVQASGQVGLVLLGASGQGLVAAWNAGTLYIYWYSGSSNHGNLTTISSTLQNGDLIEAVLDGGTITAKRNGVTVTSVANTTTLTSGHPGFETFQTGASFDDWEAGTPSSYAISGTITENSAGLGGVLVTASGGFSGSTTTAGDGTYTLSGVPENATSILLTPTRSGHTMSPLTLTVAGPVNADVTGQDFTSTATMVTPGVIAADDFNRADETPFATGGNWQQPFGGGTVNLTGQHAVGAGGEALYYWQGPGSFDNASQFARATVVQASGQVGLVLLGASGQGLVAAWNAGTLYIYWYSGSSNHGNLTTISSTLQNGDVIEAVLDGGTITAKRNGVTVTSVANTTTLTSGHPGFETFQTGASLDDWEAGTPGSYAISGTITENSAGLGGVLVTASGGFSGNTTTAGDGSYTLAGVSPGATSIMLTPTRSGYTMSPLTRTVAGPVNADVTGQDFTGTHNAGFTLTLLASHGSVIRNPDLVSYASGTMVTLTPVADGGYVFAGWSGDVPAGHESDNSLHVTMDQDRTITATFTSPDVVAADDFNRADETPLAVGGNWQQPFTGGLDHLTGDHLVSVSGEALYCWQGPGTFDNARQFARLKVLHAGGQVGVVLLGASPSQQALVVSWGAGRLYIYWYLNGSHHGELANVPSVLQDGDVIEGVLDNGTIYAKINGVTVQTVSNTTSLTSGKPGFETYLAGASFDDWEAGTPPSPDRVAALPSPGSTVSTGTPCVSVPVVFTRGDATPLMGYSVTFELSPNLSLCGAQVASAGYPLAPRQFLVTPLAGNRWTVDEVTLGTTCGVTGSATLFTLEVTSGATSGSGTITVVSVEARNCVNQPIPGSPGPTASIAIDREGPVRTLDLVAIQTRTGNPPTSATTPVRLEFTLPVDASSVEVYRRPFGGYPQYDENGGAEPAPPVALPGAGWTLTGVTGSGQSDEPPARDFWYYALLTRDAHGNPSLVSNRSAGTLNYYPGDMSNGIAACAGDDRVNVADVSLLGAHYGVSLPVNDPLECLDIGPTTDLTTNGRPLTDNVIEFEDLMILSLDYGLVSAPQLAARPAAATGEAGGADNLSLMVAREVTAGQVFDARVDLHADGRLHGLSVALEWSRAVAEPVAVRSGGLVESAGGASFAAGPAALDGAVLGAAHPGLAGDGTFAIVTFRALADGDPGVRIARVQARDRENHEVAMDGRASGLPAASAGETRLLPAAPAPFRSETTISYSLASEAQVELAVFGIEGRRVRTLQRGSQPAGEHRITWDGTDDRGRAVAAGVYYTRLSVGSKRFGQLLVRLAP